MWLFPSIHGPDEGAGTGTGCQGRDARAGTSGVPAFPGAGGNSYTHPPDEQGVAAAARRGDAQAVDQLARRHQEMAYNLAYRLLGDADAAARVTQEVLAAAQKAMARLPQDSARLRLLRLVSRACHERLRRQARRRVAAAPQPATAAAGARQQAGGQPGTEALVQAGILTLPADERLVLVLADVAGLSGQEIAEVTGLRRAAVRSQLGQARARLRNYMVAALGMAAPAG